MVSPPQRRDPGPSTPGTERNPVGVRIAGLPADALDHSRIPLSTTLALRIVAADLEIGADAEQICEELRALIGTERALPFKAALVGLRRAVHRGARLPSALDATAQAEVIGAALMARLHRHTALRAARAEAFGRLEQALPTEIQSAATALVRTAEDPLFGFGLGYASPDLYDDVRRWTRRRRLDPTRRPLDGAAVRLAKYAARAVAKPSPLTTFAAAGLARWGADLGAPVLLEEQARADVVEVALLPLARIAAALAHLPELDRAARIRVNPFARLVPSPDGDRWLFTAPGPSGEVRSLPATAALAAILEAAGDAGTPAGLRALLGGPDGHSGGKGTGQTDAVITRLLRLGILERGLTLADQSLDAATLTTWLDTHVPEQERGERLTLLLEQLRAIRDQAVPLPHADPAAHRAVAAALRARTTDATRLLGLTAAAQDPDQGTTYFHNTVTTGSAATLDEDAWRDVLADLSLVPRLLAPFDTLGPRRHALREQATTRYGAGFRQPFTVLLRDFGDWWRHTRTDTPADRDAARQAELLSGLLAVTPEDADGTVRLSPQAVRELCGDWIAPDAADDRYTCYVQTVPTTRFGPGVVLNTMTGGHGTGRTRTARLIDAAEGRAGQPADDHPGQSTLYAEFDASFSSTLNQRHPATRYAIDLDGSCSGREPSRLIRPADLDVVHDPATQRLRLEWRGDGRTVRPLHLGLLATPLLPLPARLLVEAFGQTSYAFWSDWPQLWQAVGRHHHPARTAAEPGAPARVPRIALGSVVLRRACWFVDGGRAPVRAPGEPDAGYLVAVHAWRHAHGLPMCCFLRTLTPRPAEGYAGPALHDKDRKPVYLDFSHPHLLRVFEQAAAAGRPLLLTEALPELQDAPLQRDGRRRAAEFLIELSAAPGGPTKERPDLC